MCTHCGCSSEKALLSAPDSAAISQVQGHNDPHILTMQEQLLAGNQALADHNRRHFAEQQVCCINLMGTPGAGKTALLEALLIDSAYANKPILVYEGDQASANDANRVKAAGGKALQINTDTGCHLDAQMIHAALHQMPPRDGGLLFIENVGNLVCPALFDLGESARIAMMAVTDGEDKPSKYPHMFSQCDLVLINKIDLLPYVDCDLEVVEAQLLKLNPKVAIIPVSTKSGYGMNLLIEWLEESRGNG